MKQTRSIAIALAALAGCSVKMPSLSTHAGASTSGGGGETATSTGASGGPGIDEPAGRVDDPSLFPPAVPEATPPAFRDEDGDAHGPGGPISDEPRDCGPAHDHCLRANGYFAIVDYAGVGPEPRWPVFRLDGKWLAYWKGKPAGGTVYRTIPATVENMREAREIYVFLAERHDGKATLPTGTVLSAIPTSEKEALTSGRWTRISPYEIDAKAGTYTADDAFTYQIAATRVAFDPKAADD